jgi:hypothetical protein
MNKATHTDKDDKSPPDNSPPLTLTFTEQQWITVGVAISRRLTAHDCHPVEEENLRPVALELQQVINRIWRDNWPAKYQCEGRGLPVVNFAGRQEQEIDSEYLYGGPWN